jgi:hypothetical protein
MTESGHHQLTFNATHVNENSHSILEALIEDLKGDIPEIVEKKGERKERKKKKRNGKLKNREPEKIYQS